MLGGTQPYTFDRVVRIGITVIVLWILFLLVRYLADVLIPFAIAVVLAYFLNPLVTVFEERLKRRWAAVAFTLGGFRGRTHGDDRADDVDIHVMMNMEFQDLDFEVPSTVGRHWYRAIDTAAASPADFPEPGAEERVQGDKVRVRDRSIVVLVSR